MYTISDIVADIDRGCVANNLNEEYFSYRIIFFVNENGTGKKHYIDTSYDDLWKSLECIIRGNLTTTNTVVLAAVTVRKNEETISLLSRAYSFGLGEYFQKICDSQEKEYISNNYRRKKIQWG